MPLEYAGSGVIKEHTAVRDAVGVFDVSHLGKAVVRGPGAAAFVTPPSPTTSAGSRPGQAQYTLCCDDATGGVVDDLIAYLHADDDVFLIPNAANTAEVVRRLQADAPEGVVVTNHHDDYAMLAVQGPRADEVLAAVGLPTGHDYMSLRRRPTSPAPPVVVCRTGYTGERGYELVAPRRRRGRRCGTRCWRPVSRTASCRAASAPATRCAPRWATRCTARTSASTSPRCRRGSAGRSAGRRTRSGARTRCVAEKEPGPARLLRGLVAAGRGIPRPGMRVLLAADVPIGEVTSGTFSPTLRTGHRAGAARPAR